MLDFHSAQSWRCPNKRRTVVITTASYKLTFNRESGGADGGPATVLYLLREFNLGFYLGDKLVAEGTVITADGITNTVKVQTYTDEAWSNEGEIVEVDIDSFDTVIYH